MDDPVQQLIDGAYCAAIDQVQWEGWTVRLARQLGGVCGVFNFADAGGNYVYRSIFHEDPKTIERYQDDGVDRLDPQIPFVLSVTRPSVFTDCDYLDLEKSETREYLSWMRSNGMRHCLSSATRLADGRFLAGASVHRSVADGPPTDEARRQLEQLFPDFCRAIELGFLHAEKLSQAYWEGLIGERQDACLLLGETGAVLRVTSAAEAIFRKGDGLRCVQGRLHVARGAMDGDLARFVGWVTTMGSAPSACRVERGSGRAPYILTGYPLPPREPILRSVRAAALVTIIDPAGGEPVTNRSWGAAFALTDREVEIAELLLAGHSIESAAVALGITMATIRVHLRHLFSKTGTNRQADLIRLLLRFK